MDAIEVGAEDAPAAQAGSWPVAARTSRWRSSSNPLAKCASIPSICRLAFNRALMNEEAWRIRTQATPSLPVRKPEQRHKLNLLAGDGSQARHAWRAKGAEWWAP